MEIHKCMRSKRLPTLKHKFELCPNVWLYPLLNLLWPAFILLWRRHTLESRQKIFLTSLWYGFGFGLPRCTSRCTCTSWVSRALYSVGKMGRTSSLFRFILKVHSVCSVGHVYYCPISACDLKPLLLSDAHHWISKPVQRQQSRLSILIMIHVTLTE